MDLYSSWSRQLITTAKCVLYIKRSLVSRLCLVCRPNDTYPTVYSYRNWDLGVCLFCYSSYPSKGRRPPNDFYGFCAILFTSQLSFSPIFWKWLEPKIFLIRIRKGRQMWGAAKPIWKRYSSEFHLWRILGYVDKNRGLFQFLTS